MAGRPGSAAERQVRAAAGGAATQEMVWARGRGIDSNAAQGASGVRPGLPQTARPHPLQVSDPNTDEFISHERGSPSGWIEPEIAQYPKST